MFSSGWGLIATATFFAWVLIGAVWVLPKKLALLRRLGPNVTNDQIIRLAKEGDPEAQRLRKLTWRFVVLGLLLAALFVLYGVLFPAKPGV